MEKTYYRLSSCYFCNLILIFRIMKVILFTLLLLVSVHIESHGYNSELSNEYATLRLIEATIEWHKDSEKIVRDMEVRKCITIKKIENLWRKQ